MIPIPNGARVWLATGHTDMRKGFDGDNAILKIAASGMPLEEVTLFKEKGWHLCSGAEVSRN